MFLGVQKSDVYTTSSKLHTSWSQRICGADLDCGWWYHPFEKKQNLSVKDIVKRIVDICLCCMENGVKDAVISSIVIKRNFNLKKVIVERSGTLWNEGNRKSYFLCK